MVTNQLKSTIDKYVDVWWGSQRGADGSSRAVAVVVRGRKEREVRVDCPKKKK